MQPRSQSYLRHSSQLQNGLNNHTVTGSPVYEREVQSVTQGSAAVNMQSEWNATVRDDCFDSKNSYSYNNKSKRTVHRFTAELQATNINTALNKDEC